MAPAAPQPTNVAVVVFVGKTTLRLLRLLRPGYRHCFVAVQNPRGWIVIDSLCHRTEISVLDPLPQEELLAHYRRQGCVAVVAERRSPPPKLAPIRPHSCVETVKRILGLHGPWVFTPRQLYRALQASSRGLGIYS